MRRTTWLSWAAALAFGTGAVLAAQAAGPVAGGHGGAMGGAGMGQGGMGQGGMGPGGMGQGDMGPGGIGMLAGGMIGVPQARMLERMAAELQLTADQQQQLKGVFESARPEMEQVRNRARHYADKLRAATPGAPNYDAVVSEVARNAGDLATRAVTTGAQLRAQVWAILTTAQQQKLGALQAQRQERMKARMEQRRPLQGPAP